MGTLTAARLMALGAPWTLAKEIDPAQVVLTTTPTVADWTVGTTLDVANMGRYVYVQAVDAIAQYDCVAIDEDFNATPAESTILDANSIVGFAQVAFADNDFGWVALEGTNINCRVITGTGADEALYADSRTSLAGQLQSLTSLGTLLLGVRNVAASNTSTSVNPEVSARCVVPFVAT